MRIQRFSILLQQIFCLMFIISCQEKKHSESILVSKNPKINNEINRLFTKASTEKRVTFFSNKFESKHFLYFKSGDFLTKTNKNALIIDCPTDSTYTISIFQYDKEKWHLINRISNLYGSLPQFEITYKDYNFDKQTDIFIQKCASNGWSLSKGHLFILDKRTLKMTYQNDVTDLANINVDSKTKIVKSESHQGYNSEGKLRLTFHYHKWEKDHLKEISQKDTLIY